MCSYSAAELWQVIYKPTHYIGDTFLLPIAGFFISGGKSSANTELQPVKIRPNYGLKLIL